MSDDSPDVPADDATPSPEPATDDKPLGESGEKALAVWKDRAKKAEAEAKRTQTLEAELAQLREAQMSDQEKALDQARREGAEGARSETLTAVNRKLFAAEVRALAAGKITDPDLIADPEMALRLLGFDDIPVTDTGDIDGEAISASLGALLEAKPYLQASATRPSGVDFGARATPPIRTIEEQIEEAESKGDYKTSTRLKTQLMLAASRG